MSVLSAWAPAAAQTAGARATAFHFHCGADASRDALPLTPGTLYSQERGYGFRDSVVAATTSLCESDRPFLFDLALPEGNYDVAVTLGHPTHASETTVKAESRRLMLEQVRTRANEFVTRTFTAVEQFALPASPIAAASDKHYLFAYFKGNGEDGMHLAHSTDGLAWCALKGDNAFFTPTVGREKLTRDPSIVRGPDGVYHMVWTAGWNERGFGYAESRDLISWTGERYVPVMEHEPTAKNTWAPELLYDAPNARYLIYWATTIPGRFAATDSAGGGDGKYNHRIYYVSTTDFRIFTPARLLYELGFSVIDADIIRDGSRYVMFLKDETERPPQKNIRLAFADRAEGPWSAPGAPITGDYWAEGPTALRVGQRWVVYFDRYRDHYYGALASSDLVHWTDITSSLSLPAGIRHGTAFEVPAADARRLLERERP